MNFAAVPGAPEPRAGESSTLYVERVEALLAAAQMALGSQRPEEARAALAECEGLLRAHPELPQAAWLAAERAAITAELASSENSDRMRAARVQALVLEGPRAAAFHRDAAGADAALPPLVSFSVRGLAPGDELEWDAARATTNIDARVGEHQLRVLRGGRLLWASWQTISSATRELNLNLPPLAPCSADDLALTRDDGSKPLPSPNTLCPRWAVARTVGAEVELALCERAKCSNWRRGPAEPNRAPLASKSPERAALPAWTLYVAGGVGAALLGGFIAAEAGAFTPNETRERWRYEGLR
jgi:hypothetical protein